MKKKLRHYQQINDFLEGSMNENDKKAFDQALKNDQELAHDLAFVMATNQLLLQYSDEDMAEFESSTRKPRNRKVIRYTIWTTAAAAILLLGLWLYSFRFQVLNNQERNKELLVAVNANEPVLRTAGGSTWKQDLLQELYPEALQKIEMALKKFPPGGCPAEDLQYWKGVILLCDRGDATQAVAPLQCALQEEYQTESSARLLMIALLETGQIKAAKAYADQFPSIALKLPRQARKRLE